MSLEKRIMALLKVDDIDDDAFESGYELATREAAQLAKEADELMEEMASCLEHIWKQADSPWAEIAGATLVKFDKYKDQTK